MAREPQKESKEFRSLRALVAQRADKVLNPDRPAFNAADILGISLPTPVDSQQNTSDPISPTPNPTLNEEPPAPPPQSGSISESKEGSSDIIYEVSDEVSKEVTEASSNTASLTTSTHQLEVSSSVINSSKSISYSHDSEVVEMALLSTTKAASNVACNVASEVVLNTIHETASQPFHKASQRAEREVASDVASGDHVRRGPTIQGGTLQKEWNYPQNPLRIGLPFDNLSNNEKAAITFLIRNLAEPDNGGTAGWTDIVKRQFLTQELLVKGPSGVKYVLQTLGERGYLLRGEQWIVGARRGTRYRLNPRLVPQIRSAMRTSSTNPTGLAGVASRGASREASETVSGMARHVASREVTREAAGVEDLNPLESTTTVVPVSKEQQLGIETGTDAELILAQLDLSEWEPYGLDPLILSEFVGKVSVERLQTVLDIIAHNERTLRSTPRKIDLPIRLLIKYLRLGGNGPLWPEKGFKPREQRQAEEMGRIAAEAEAKRAEAELLRFKTALTERQRQWIRQEAAKVVESRQKGDLKIPDRMITKVFEEAEREIMRERFSLFQMGRAVPESS